MLYAVISNRNLMQFTEKWVPLTYLLKAATGDYGNFVLSKPTYYMSNYIPSTTISLEVSNSKQLPIIATAPFFTQLNKNGEPVHHKLMDTEVDIVNQEFVLIKGIVRNPEKNCADMFHMLEEGKVIALEEGRGSSFEHMRDESVLFHALIPKQAPSEYKEVLLKGKEWLKNAFSGWHHIYHEVFAAAQVLAIQSL